MAGEDEKPDWQLEWEAEQREILHGVSFPLFAPEGLRLELSSWGGGDGEPVQSVGLRHESGEDRWIEVDSEVDEEVDDAESEAAWHLEGLGDAPVEAASEPKPLRVDGVDRPFAFAAAGNRWVAIGTVGDVTITVHARGSTLRTCTCVPWRTRLDWSVPESLNTVRADRTMASLILGGLRSLPERRRSRTSAPRWPALLEAGSPCW